MLTYSVQPGLGDVDMAVVDDIVDGGGTLGVDLVSNVAVGQGVDPDRDGNVSPGDTSDGTGCGATAAQLVSSRPKATSSAVSKTNIPFNSRFIKSFLARIINPPDA
jgi:hypothetical protein